MKTGFDSEKYLKLQTENILKKIEKFNNKLYLEFGGKIFDDLHAARVLPGFKPDIKVELLKKLKDKTEIIFVISAVDIERNKIRADFGITYDMEVLRLVDNLRDMGLTVSAVCITLFNEQASAKIFANKLEARGEKVYFHRYTKGYPTDVNVIVSDEGYGANPYIETSRPLVVITAPGPGSGKLATCLSQLYHEYKRGVKAGYAKFETFPVWNLPLKHPVNVAYEAATADLKDINMIDNFHFNTYGKLAVNYNRDLEMFPVLKNILNKITKGENVYNSPTDMGVNMIGNAIIDNDVVCEAAKQEIVRRYYKTWCQVKQGLADRETAERVELLMHELEIEPEIRKCVLPAIEKTQKTKCPAVAIELSDGTIVTGRNKGIMSASASAVLNALKHLAEITDNVDLIAPEVLKPILDLKHKVLSTKDMVLTVNDVLIALSVSTNVNPIAKNALTQVKKLKNAEMHSTFILNPSDEKTLRRLGINWTCEPQFLSRSLFDV